MSRTSSRGKERVAEKAELLIYQTGFDLRLNRVAWPWGAKAAPMVLSTGVAITRRCCMR